MTTAAPAAPAELEELLGDDTKLKALMGDPEAFKSTISAYVRKVNEQDKSLQAQVREQVQAGLADLYRENGMPEGGRPNVTPHAAHGTNRGQHYSPKAAGAVLDGKFEHIGELMGLLAGERAGRRDASTKLGELRNAFSSAVPADGGFLIPEEFRAELLRTALESSIVRSRARVIPMAQPRISFPMVEDTNHTSSLFGGIIGYWTEEQAALVASSAKFGKVTLDAAKLTGYTEIPNELLADSAISVAAFVDQAFPQALAWFEDDAFIRGNGVGQPLGFLNAPAAVTVAAESAQGANTIKLANILKMYSRMLPTSLDRAVWIANIDTFPQLMTLATDAGSISPIMLTNVAGAPPISILGRPVLFTEKAETLGTAGDINFVDLGYYLIGDRQQISAMTSEHFKFNTDTTAYRIIERVDGRPWLQNAITPQKGSATLSPFVKLSSTRT